MVSSSRAMTAPAKCRSSGLLGYFFKAPITREGTVPEHALHTQEQVLLGWLDGTG